jgi:hypothetical protein
MTPSRMLLRVTPVRTDVSEELRASFIRVTRFSELGTTLAVTSNRRSVPSGEKREKSTLLGPLERANLNESKGPSRKAVSRPTPDEGNGPNFMNMYFLVT